VRAGGACSPGRGRTYADIAASLFISEKPVSMHVSNPLRKTGIRARIKLAERVKRLGGVRTTQ